MNFAAFDLNLLRVFDALLHEGSATRAGERVGLSQPAVSAALNRLRQALDDQLFVRAGARMVPTPKAQALASPIAEALGLLERSLGADARFDPASSERTFTILAADFFTLTVFPALAARLSVEAPGMRLRVLEIPAGGIERPLLEGLADIALERAHPAPEWMASEPQFHSAFAVIAARGHAELAAAGVAPGGIIPLELYCALPHALRTIEGDLVGATDEVLAAMGLRRRVALAVTQFTGVLAAVARSRMIAAVPAEFAAAFADGAGVEIYRSPIDMPVSRLDMFWHRRQSANPGHRWLRSVLAETIRAEGLALQPVS